ncbi:MAG: YdcF family protein [Candidatus Liberibacter ctenarytainae]|uniref:YdcF family protein n=1 Tax=Candidatus Liberibacter ctenarytainae TaxID=2020335 RepID=A0A937AJA9_9HYPH|nr:YdcF family protein [Candidatus Liberibacter ctenarytainae]
MVLSLIISLFIFSFLLYWLQKPIVAWISLGLTLLLIWCIGCGLVPIILLKHLQYSYMHAVLSPQWKDGDNIIVLLGNGTTIIQASPRAKIEPSPQAYSRIFETIRLYRLCKQQQKHCTILISGGDPQKHGIEESTIYRDKLLEIGIESIDIKLETHSLNTLQNAQLSSSIISSMFGDKLSKNVIIVSSAYHLQRSQLYFKRFGIDTIASRADYITAHYSIIPSAFNIYLTELALKEYIGYWVGKFTY